MLSLWQKEFYALTIAFLSSLMHSRSPLCLKVVDGQSVISLLISRNKSCIFQILSEAITKEFNFCSFGCRGLLKEF